LTTEERVRAVADYGYTERQARFLVLVIRHAGLCVKRQYAALAGVANGGEKCNAFFDKLVRRGHATTVDCIHNRARLYHVHYRPLYHAIGEPESRYRRTVSARSATERLMRVDAALTGPNLDWLTTRPEKVAYVRAKTALESSDPSGGTKTQQTADLADAFPGTFPIGIDPGGRVVVLYLATVPWADDFRTFLLGHLPLLQVLPVWTLRLVYPAALHRAFAAYQTVVEEELNSPLQANIITDLKRYFFHRRRGTDLDAIPEALRAFLVQCAQVFAGPRFSLLYKRWLTEGEAVLAPISPAISAALASGRAHFEGIVLPHSYQHLSPLVNRRRPRRRARQRREEGGDGTLHSINPPVNLVP
jgi:hypothetical protein